MRKWLITLMSIQCIAGSAAMAQADRHYVQAHLAYVAPSGSLVDSANFSSTMAYAVGYQWSPSRSTSFGVMGSYTPADVLDKNPASVFGITAVGTYRFIKHGFTPYASAEVGFGFLSIADSLVGRRHLDPQLGLSLAGSVGFLIPISQKVEIDAAARYAQASLGAGLKQVNAVLGLRYRLR